MPLLFSRVSEKKMVKGGLFSAVSYSRSRVMFLLRVFVENISENVAEMVIGE
jgi:hypothetical protein